jgi:hypothetical protein
VFWDTFGVAEANVLLDGSGITLEGGVCPPVLNGLGNLVPGMGRKQQRIVVYVEEKVGARRWVECGPLSGG